MTWPHPLQDAVLVARADGQPRTAVAIEIATGLLRSQVANGLKGLLHRGVVVRAGWLVRRGDPAMATRFGAFVTASRVRLWRLA